ncbi:MAG: HNH endonuclease [Cryobacterium sp.]|uniref:HNH endonuclease signature motif containing protein n=1 Tax=Cryobacterium sp. TaxID=1926290 RepID=UPI002297D284|nr:HNH endonuclease signature motif containing protein [Cryobacterium sp.]MCY7404078.1 HNH endonuclease [Cryobacterium sp.]
MNNVALELTQAAAAVAALGGSSAEFSRLSDAQVLAARGPIADLLRLSNTAAALLAGTIAERSRPQWGQSGLAARQGFGNPTLMVQHATGLSRIDAGRLLAVGVLMSDTETAERLAAERLAADAARDAAPLSPAPPVAPLPVVLPVVLPVPWQAPIVHAVADGRVSPGVADALLRGLGTLDQAITAEKLAAALRVLLATAPGMNTEQAYKRARRLRDDLDAAGVLAREKQARDDTSWSLWRRADGMVTLHALLPPEQGELWLATYDALTSPRRGGVRFVDPERAAWAQSVKDDPRTLDQIAADSFTQLLTLGADADPNTLFGGRRPSVRVIVTEHNRPTIPSGGSSSGKSAFGYLEGNPAPVSGETIDRHLCGSGYLGILFDHTGQPLNIGRDQRLFTTAQRHALAVRDGGCRWPSCDQPPSWTETHHIENWLTDHGLTNIDHAILLCAPHHLLLHNRGWKVLHKASQYWLQPPAEIDPEQTLIALPSKNPLMTEDLRLDPTAVHLTGAGTDNKSEARDGGLDTLDQRNTPDQRDQLDQRGTLDQRNGRDQRNRRDQRGTLDQRYGRDPRPGHPPGDWRN